MAVKILQAAFDSNEEGEVVVSLPSDASSKRVLKVANDSPGKIRFARKPRSQAEAIFGMVFSIGDPEFFHPGFACVYASYLRTFNGRGFAYAHIFLKHGDDWKLVEVVTLDPTQSLDLQGYVKNTIEGPHPLDPEAPVRYTNAVNVDDW